MDELIFFILTQGYFFIALRESVTEKEREGEGEEKGGERQCKREAVISCLWHMPGPGIEPTS